MTDEEMNEFLESIGGLENSCYRGKEPIKNCNIFYCDNGWFPIIKELIEDLIKLGWDKQICQVKEKFGGIRFYINGGSDEIYDRIRKAEEQSFKTCEITGLPGELRQDIGWWRTLCDEEYKKIKEKIGN